MSTPGTTGRTRGARLAPLPLVLLPLALASCGGRQNVLNPQSHASGDIANLFWVMTAVAFGGLLLVTGIMVAAWVRRGRGVTEGHPGDRETGERRGNAVVIALGVVMPICVVCALFVIGDTMIINVTQAPAAAQTALTVKAIGHQWYWEFEYPGTRAVTADELHIPVGTRVNLVATTKDVIHSFWVPTLNRKIDTIDGYANRIELYANKVGVYRGECAEYCGLQHAHMSMLVFVQSQAAFRRWLAHESANARPPATALQRKGEQVFLNGPCSSCHTIRGTSATGYLGPDLTHLASRTTLAGVTIPNSRRELGDWIESSQRIKPGNQMPDIRLAGPQLQALLAYLEHLK